MIPVQHNVGVVLDVLALLSALLAGSEELHRVGVNDELDLREAGLILVARSDGVHLTVGIDRVAGLIGGQRPAAQVIENEGAHLILRELQALIYDLRSARDGIGALVGQGGSGKTGSGERRSSSTDGELTTAHSALRLGKLELHGNPLSVVWQPAPFDGPHVAYAAWAPTQACTA